MTKCVRPNLSPASIHTIDIQSDDVLQATKRNGRRKGVALRSWVVLLAAALPFAAQADQAWPLFWSNFDGQTTIQPINPAADCWDDAGGNGCWQHITGTDGTTTNGTAGGNIAYTWPPNIWGGGGAAFLMVTNIPGANGYNIARFMSNELVTLNSDNLDGPSTFWNRALYSDVREAHHGQNPMYNGAPDPTQDPATVYCCTQNGLVITPVAETSDLYISYWLRLQPGMTQDMKGLHYYGTGGTWGDGTWRELFAFKTGTPGASNGDYRIGFGLATHNTSTPYLECYGDNQANGNYPLVNNWSVSPITWPQLTEGKWTKVEIFWHRSSSPNGYFWAALDGHAFCEHNGANMGAASLPINRIIFDVYTGGRYPAYQWMDKLQIWDHMMNETQATGHPWYDPPYGANP
jgi:hypothetical protein